MSSSGQSGWLEGWAAWNSGLVARLAATREMVGNRVMSTWNLLTIRVNKQ